MAGPREVAEAFSSHRFAEAYPALADDVRWVLVGEDTITGRQAVIEACESTLAGLSTATSEFLRFVVIAEGEAVAVDAVGRYVDAQGGASVVSSCDLYAFRDGLITSITSYTVELDPGTMTSPT